MVPITVPAGIIIFSSLRLDKVIAVVVPSGLGDTKVRPHGAITPSQSEKVSHGSTSPSDFCLLLLCLFPKSATATTASWQAGSDTRCTWSWHQCNVFLNDVYTVCSEQTGKGKGRERGERDVLDAKLQCNAQARYY